MQKIKKVIYCLLGICLVGSILAGCTSRSTDTIQEEPAGTGTPFATATPSLTPTPDLCSPGYVQQEAKKINDLMREFDDLTYVANLTPQQQLGEKILQLSEIRRNEEDVIVPECLDLLHDAAVDYMNAVISYLGAFMGGGSSDQVSQIIGASQNIRAYYNVEYARVQAIGTPTSNIPTPTSTPFQIMVTNKSGQGLNLRPEPLLTTNVTATLPAGESAPATAINETGEWLLITYNDEQLWVFAAYVKTEGDLDLLPIILPTATPSPTLAATFAPGTAIITNPGSKALNLREGPALDAAVIELLDPQSSVPALAVDESGLWLMVDYNGQHLWIYASLVELNVELESVPMITLTATPTITETVPGTRTLTP